MINPAPVEALSIETPSGKYADYENFPVGSILLPAKARPHVATFYHYARAIDDIADSNTLSPEEKINRLDSFAAAIKGEKYDDEALKRLIYANGKIESRKYSELKSYLYELILKSLQGYDEKSSIDFKLKGMLQSIRVLFKRSHYEDCKELLQKVKEKSYELDYYIILLKYFH